MVSGLVTVIKPLILNGWDSAISALSSTGTIRTLADEEMASSTTQFLLYVVGVVQSPVAISYHKPSVSMYCKFTSPTEPVTSQMMVLVCPTAQISDEVG